MKKAFGYPYALEKEIGASGSEADRTSDRLIIY